MPSSTISVFNEPDDFQAALREAGCSNLLVTEGGQFQARMTKMALDRIWLSSAEERLSRVAFMRLAPGLVRISLPTQTGTLVSGGTEIGSGEIATHGASGPLHERLHAPSRWGDIVVPAHYLARYGRVLQGAPIDIPSGPRVWRPTAEALDRLTALHAGAMRVAGTRPGKAPGAEAARGLEQELIYAMVQCLSAGPVDAHADAADRHTHLLARFEQMVTAHPQRPLAAREISSALGVADRTLRSRCQQHLAMGPTRYWRLYRMQLVRRTLRSADASMVGVSEVAGQYGFMDPSRFAVSYRALFGETPSATLQRHLGR